MKGKDTVILLFLIIAGLVVGGLIANVTKTVPSVSWLSYSKTIGLDAGKPAYIDLVFLKLAFGFEMNINIAEVICVLAALFAFKKIK